MCGDKIRVIGKEGCDDGDLNDGFGCKDDCSGPLPGWNCSVTLPNRTSFCIEINDDGLVVGFETCDDGITNWGC